MPDKPLFPIINTDSIRKEDANAGRSGTADRIGLHTGGKAVRAASACGGCRRASKDGAGTHHPEGRA